MDNTYAARLVALCTARGLRVATAESCTGGMISATITDIPGASAIFDRGFVTYSNDAKRELLDVDDETLEKYGAVSEQTAIAMAQGAIVHSAADVAVAVTGIAGPGGGSPEKPVGLVFLAIATRFGKTRTDEHVFPGPRAHIRESAAELALEMLVEAVENY